MAELKIYISDGLNERFRRLAMSVHGYGRGSLSKAAEEAFAEWCKEHESPSVSREKVDSSGAVHDQPNEIESHVNPDEREGASHQASRIGDNNFPNQTRATT